MDAALRALLLHRLRPRLLALCRLAWQIAAEDRSRPACELVRQTQALREDVEVRLR
jgi:hypothetical protein